MMKAYLHQKGVAAIVFVIIFPFFFGFFALAIEGTRYLTTSARLSDVLESASLAVAAAVDHDDDKDRVKAYINATISDADVDDSDITITSQSCEEIYGDECGVAEVYDKEGLQFNEYNVQVTTSFLSCFPGSDIVAGFNKNQTLVNNAVTRKYQQKFVDVVFVTDMSGSMLDDFGSDNKAKYAGVIDIIESINDTLNSYNELAERSDSSDRNYVGIVPYSEYNKTIDDDELTSNSYSYSSGSSNWWGSTSQGVTGPTQQTTLSPSFSATELYDDGYNLHTEYPDGVPELGSAEPNKQLVQEYFDWTLGEELETCTSRGNGNGNGHNHNGGGSTSCSTSYSWEYDYWDYQDDASDWWNSSDHEDARDRNYKIRNYIGCANYTSGTDWRNNCSYTGYFFNIALTDDFDSITNQIENFFPSGSTSSSQGIIPAAQMLLNKTSSNTDNLIIVLSDGEDTDSNLSLGYYDSGLCDYLREQFTNKGQTLKIAVIGFDYDTSENPGLAECADSNDILTATSYEDIYSKILSLITEEIGHLYTHDYSSEASD
ncbi:hypothetical protein [Celerinatantimonas sp. MCCC 1A17872]|uniref:hypothetical protein n=1 Tax=Celerinatantimonas sp. MCCC 1A17872 TaxID=3177514 RepID=UPI0038C241A4